MSSLWKKIEFYKGKSNYKAIVIAAWICGAEPLWGFRSKAQTICWLFNDFKAIKQLTMALRNYILRLRSYTSS